MRKVVAMTSMEEAVMQSQTTSTDKSGNVIVDIDSLTQALDKCNGSPKVSKALSRKGSRGAERRNNEEQDAEDSSRKIVLKVVCSQLDQLKHPLVAIKSPSASQNASGSSSLADSLDGRNKKFNRLTSIHPRKILLLFASMSSMGTMILIYFTLAINRRGGA